LLPADAVAGLRTSVVMPVAVVVSRARRLVCVGAAPVAVAVSGALRLVWAVWAGERACALLKATAMSTSFILSSLYGSEWLEIDRCGGVKLELLGLASGLHTAS